MMLAHEPKEDGLHITINAAEPKETKSMLIKGIAAAFRWESQCNPDDKYKDESENKYALARLLESLAD